MSVWKREPRFSAMREVGAQMVPIKLHLLADERRPRGVPASRLEGVVVRKGKGKGKGAHGESLLFDPGEAHDCLRQFEHVLVAPPPGELQRAMVLDVEASTAPGTFAKVVVVYPAKEKNPSRRCTPSATQVACLPRLIYRREVTGPAVGLWWGVGACSRGTVCSSQIMRQSPAVSLQGSTRCARCVFMHARLSELWRSDCDCMYTRPQVGNLHDQHSQLHMAEEAFKCFEGATAIVVANDR